MIKNALPASTTAVAVAAAAVVVGTAPFVTLYMTVATINLFLIHAGFTVRKTHRRAHASLMLTGIVSDLALVVILQVTRSAVQTALAFKLSAPNQAHIFCSTAATVLYLPMVVLGMQLLFSPGRRDPNSHDTRLVWHRRLGFATLVFRTLGFFLMFSMLKPR